MLRLTHRQKPLTLYEISRGFTYVIIIFPFFFYVLLDLLRFPSVLKFIVDLAWIGIIGLSLFRGKLRIDRKVLPFVILVSVFVIYTLLVYLFRFQSPFYYLWGIRNYLRFYIAFFAVATYFRNSDAQACLKLIDVLFWVSAALCLLQFLGGYEQDYIGGIFGTNKGCNGYVTAHLSIVVTKTFLQYMNGKEKNAVCFLKCAVALLIAAVAELKFFYLVFAFVLILSAVLNGFSVRKVVLFLVGFALISIGATILEMMYSYFEGFLSIEAIMNAFKQKGYASSVDIGRTNAISFITRRFLHTVPDQLFGLGLGNCDTSTLTVFNTEFHRQHVDLHYSIFSYAFMFLENGYIGLLLYVSFFMLCFLQARKVLKEKPTNPLFAQMGIILSLLCFALIIYNSSLRTEAGYMVYFVLALPYLKCTDEESSIR